MGELNNQEHKHINRERLCYHCNELTMSSEEIHKFTINGREHLSNFVDEEFTIQLCEHCAKDLEVEKDWFDNELCFDEMTGNYRGEHYILGLIETFPIYNQEYILNSYNANYCSHIDEKRTSREDWIKDNM